MIETSDSLMEYNVYRYIYNIHTYTYIDAINFTKSLRQSAHTRLRGRLNGFLQRGFLTSCRNKERKNERSGERNRNKEEKSATTSERTNKERKGRERKEKKINKITSLQKEEASGLGLQAYEASRFRPSRRPSFLFWTNRLVSLALLEGLKPPLGCLGLLHLRNLFSRPGDQYRRANKYPRDRHPSFTLYSLSQHSANVTMEIEKSFNFLNKIFTTHV